MFALVDCNNFYASCERLFQPEFRGKPVVVLSNNDGCVIARSQEAKDLGVHMGTPWHLVDAAIRDQVKAFSSNYTLYADMSARVMNNLARFTPNVEIYSIDECFLSLTGFSNLESYGNQMRQQIIRNTGIPVSVGVAPSKTLAKLANRMAKNFNGLCVLETPEKIDLAVKDFKVEEIWGIGRQYAKKLPSFGILTAHDLRSQPLEWVQEKLTIQGVRMWYELHGKSCIQLASMTERKQGIRSSRSFGKLTGDYTFLEEATVAYCTRVSEKLRKDKSCATLLSIRLLTNIHRPETTQYTNSVAITLPHPTNNILELVKHAVRGLKSIFKPSYLYLKVEVYATGLIPEREVQLNLFSNYDGKRKNEVSELMDRLNNYYGKGTLILAAEGFEKKWSMRRNFLSPPYTTEWDAILRVR
ncbi:Y-family DNA polymerase [Daejeonella sp.]|uniref:Y-family DNA polymerase n=1 Tax=Daejeonella sp. TaxID=2805397 RepID=UPI00398361CC